MERAIGNRSLVSMTKTGQDDEASKIICEVVTRLHAKSEVARMKRFLFHPGL